MKVVNNIDFDNPTDLIKPNYPNQFPRQAPIYLVVSLGEDETEITAEARCHCGNPGVSAAEWHGHIQTVPLPDSVDACELRDFVDERIMPIVERIAEGYESAWDGSNHVARFSDEAHEALWELRAIEHQYAEWPTLDSGGLWDADEWLAPSIDGPTEDNPTARIEGFGEVTAETTAAELVTMAEAIEAEALHEGAVFDQDAYDALEALREECEEMTAAAPTCPECGAPVEVTVETIPECDRESHRAAGNSGVWPHNGADRIEMCRACAEELVEADPEWSEILGD